jgi:hypothetical protein
MEALHRVRDTMAITPKIAPKITLKSATVALLRPFSGECCFQVIYFVSNISSSPPCRSESDGPCGNRLVNARG